MKWLLGLLYFLLLFCASSAPSKELPAYEPHKPAKITLIYKVENKAQKGAYSKDKLETAINEFIILYGKKFKIDKNIVSRRLDGLNIELSKGSKIVELAHGVSGDEVRKVAVSGLVLGKNLIWVEIEPGLVCRSSLIHELVHIMIWRETGKHPDPDHEGPLYEGWTPEHTKFIKKTNKKLCKLGI